MFGPPLTARRARDDDEDMFFVEEEEGATGKKKRAKTTATAGGGEGKPKAPRASRAAMSTTVYEEGTWVYVCMGWNMRGPQVLHRVCICVHAIQYNTDESFDADALAADYVAAADGGDGGATGALGQRMHAQVGEAGVRVRLYVGRDFGRPLLLCVFVFRRIDFSSSDVSLTNSITRGVSKRTQLLTAARLGAAHNKAEVAIVETGVGERPTFIASFAFQSKQFQVCGRDGGSTPLSPDLSEELPPPPPASFACL